MTAERSHWFTRKQLTHHWCCPTRTGPLPQPSKSQNCMIHNSVAHPKLKYLYVLHLCFARLHAHRCLRAWLTLPPRWLCVLFLDILRITETNACSCVCVSQPFMPLVRVKTCFWIFQNGEMTKLAPNCEGKFAPSSVFPLWGLTKVPPRLQMAVAHQQGQEMMQ